MKAKISYTIDIDSIPREINRLLLPEIDKLQDLLKDSNFSVTKSNLDLVLLRIDLLRQYLLDVDTKAEECYSILQGYKQAIAPPKKEEEVDDGVVSK